MYSIDKLEKQQVGIRLPKYLIEEIDSFTKEYNVNRTDIITESVKAYLEAQKEKVMIKKALEEEKNGNTFEHNEVWSELLQ